MVVAFTVYLVIFLAGIAFIAVSALFGGLSDVSLGDASLEGPGVEHADAWGSEQAQLSPLSPLMLSILATLFGVGGMLLTSFSALTAPVVLLVALVAAVGIYGGVYVLIQKFFYESQASSVIRTDEAIGSIATVTTRIVPGSVGAVDYVAGGRRVSASARSRTKCEVGENVRITQMHGNVVQVEKL